MQYTEDTRAIFTVHFLSDQNEWLPLEALFDTGSDVTVLPWEFATKLQWLGPQMPIIAREVVGSVSMIYTHCMIAVMGKTMRVPMITSAFILDPLLGMSVIKDNFEITLRPEGFRFRPLEPQLDTNPFASSVN